MKTTARFQTIMVGALLGVAFASPTALAGIYEPIPNPVGPHAGSLIPSPELVPGKEYSHELDRSSDGANLAHEQPALVYRDDQQNTMWDGQGGVADTFDYNDAPHQAGAATTNPNNQVDAIAHHADALFFEAVSNAAAILFSTRVGPNIQGQGADAGADNAPNRTCQAGDPICSEHIDGAITTWATWEQVDQHGGTNLDALEVWGPEGSDNADRFSLFNDFASGCSVWAGTGPGSVCVVPQAMIAALFPALPADLVDIDALMVNDDWLMFSLWPTLPGLPEAIGDGVWVWRIGTPTAEPLEHGGHLWIDGWLGLNIDALEAVAIPEIDAAAGTGALALLGGALALAGERRRRHRAA